MATDLHFFPPQKPRFFAFSPAKTDSKKSVKYISGPELTMKGRIGLAEMRPPVFEVPSVLSAR